MAAPIAQILWQAPRLLPLAVTIGCITVLVVLVFYVPQARRLRQPWRWGLPLLRLAVGLALAVSVVQPAVVWSESDDQHGAVVVLIDDSRSMSVIDPRPPAQRVALAAALGLLPAEARTVVAPGLDRELDGLRKQLDSAAAAAADVQYAKLSGQGVIAAQTRYDALAAEIAQRAADLASRGRGMPQPSELAEHLIAFAPAAEGDGPVDYRTRIDATRRALAAAQAKADAELYARPDVKLICDELATLSRAQLAARAVTRAPGSVLASLPTGGVYAFTFAAGLEPLPPAGAATSPAPIDAAGLRSDIVGAVRAAAQRMGGRNLQAMVVLTDGRQVGGDSAVTSSLAEAGVPVYAVPVTGSSPRDVSITDLSLPQRQFVGESTTARVQLHGTGMKGRKIDVKLEAAGQVQAKSVTLDEPSATVQFQLKFDVPAVYEVDVSVAPQGEEITTANNTVRRWVVATDDRASVTLVGGYASWDFQYLRRALSRAPWASLDAEVLDAPGARWSMTAEQMAQQSVVVLADVREAQLTARQWDALYGLVADRGGSVIFVAGRNTASPDFIDSPLLTDLLPFRAGSRPAWRTWPGEQPLFRFQPAPGAADLAALKLDNAAASSPAERWLELPALFQYLPVAELKANTTPLLVERESGLAVLTESRLGLGRILFFGANETWRWRQDDGGAEAHERFWLQLLRHATDDPYAVRAGALRLDASAVSLEPGQPLHVRAKISHPASPSLPQASAGESGLRLRVTRDGTQVAEVMLTPQPATAGQYAGRIDDLAAGSYLLTVQDPREPSSVAALPIHVQPDAEPEMRDVTGDERLLRRLAGVTGGELLPLTEWDTLPRRLSEARQTQRQVAQRRLWDSPQLFAFVLGCLGLEWAMRKRLGMA